MAILPYNLNLPNRGDAVEDPFDVNDILDFLARFPGDGDKPFPPPVGSTDLTINIIFPQVDKERNKPISPFISSKLPEFVVVDHNIFVDFTKAYYEWLERSGNPVYISRRFQEYINIDETLDTFLPYFLSTYAPFLPDELGSNANLKTVIPNMIDFYKKKGTKDSLKFFFRLLYNIDIELFYPKLQLFKTSDGKYKERYLINAHVHGLTSGSLPVLVGRKIKQLLDNRLLADATVESVVNIMGNGGPYQKFELSGLYGDFVEGVTVEIPIAGDSEYATIIPSIKTLTVSTGGANYLIGDKITITGTGPGAFVSGFRGEVGSINSYGTITSVNILDGGIRASGIKGSTYTVSIASREGTGATLEALGGGGKTVIPPYYDGEVSRLSSGSYLQDNFYYQEFSYVIRTPKGILDYIDLLRKLVHPAGLKPFGRYLLVSNNEFSPTKTTQTPTRFEIPLLGHYMPYTFGTTQNLRNSAGGADLYPIGFNGVTMTMGDHTGIVDEGGANQHVVGVTGALGSTLGGALGHTIGGGLGAVGIYNDGGTGYLNRADFYEQYEIFAGGISGPTFSGYTMGWSVYPHPAHRGATHIFGGMSMGCTFNQITIEVLDQNWEYAGMPNVSVGDIIVQYPWDYAPSPVGIISAIDVHDYWSMPDLIVWQITTEQPFVSTFKPGVQQGTVVIYDSSGAVVYQSENGIAVDVVGSQHSYPINLDPKMAYIQIGDFIREMPA